MNQQLLKAAMSGDSDSLGEMAAQDPSILLGTTPQGNTCLYISSIHGHETFCTGVLALNNVHLGVANSNGETPLLGAVKSGQAALASFLLRRCLDGGFKEAILTQDSHGCNALHYAIRDGHKSLAFELIVAEPALSQGVNNYEESPMFIAVMRDFTDIFERLLGIPDSADVGTYGRNALHAAVRNCNTVIAERLMETRPGLARVEDKSGSTPMHLAVIWGKADVLRVLLQHDWSLGYVVSGKDYVPLLNSAGYRGCLSAARELLSHCPDPPYYDATGWTCLHAATKEGHAEFIEFILDSPYLREVINMRDKHGKTALHYAVKYCNPRIVAALLSHGCTDLTMLDNEGHNAASELWNATDYAKTIKWVQIPDFTNSSVVCDIPVDSEMYVATSSMPKYASLVSWKYS